MKNLGLINPENVTEDEARMFTVREAARAIAVDNENRIALLNVSNKHYFKLPGGGIEKGEDHITALRRECLEEIGCDVEIITEIGMITEYRKLFSLTQISYCYLAKVKGEKGSPQLEQGEIAGGFKEVWLTYDEALQAMNTSNATTREGALYIVPRDTTLLKEARAYLEKINAQGV